MDKDTHVPCTNCIHFDDNLKCINNCNTINEISCNECKCNGCDCGDLEDSMAFEFRPNYVAMEEY